MENASEKTTRNDTSAFDKALPTVLRELMKQHKTTQEQLAGTLGKTRQTISNYRSGINAPDWETIVKIAHYYGVSSDYLLGMTEDPSPKVSAVDELGLSANAIERLKEVHEGGICTFRTANFISALLSSEQYPQIIRYLDATISTIFLFYYGLDNKKQNGSTTSEIIKSGGFGPRSFADEIFDLAEFENLTILPLQDASAYYLGRTSGSLEEFISEYSIAGACALYEERTNRKADIDALHTENTN